MSDDIHKALIDIDQSPSLLWTMYSNLKKQGFSEKQAMDILDSYIFATFTPDRGEE